MNMRTLIKFLFAVMALGVVLAIFFWKVLAIIIVVLILRRVFFGSRMERKVRKQVKFEEKYKRRYNDQY